MKIPDQPVYPAPFDWSGVTKRYMNPGELERLITLFRGMEPVRVAEFGVNDGRTAKAILDNVPSIKTYIGVDVLPGYTPACEVQRGEVPQYPGHLAQSDPRFQLLLTKNGTRDVTPQMLGELDACFIDGDHSFDGVRKDSILAHQCMHPGKLIVWHDYHDLGTVGVQQYLDESFEAGDIALTHVKDTWLVYKVTY